MLHNLEIILKVGNRALMQLPVETGIFTLEEDFAFSGSQFLLAMLSGLAMAFAFQFLFTNLAIAFVASPGTPSGLEDDSDSLGDAVRGIETKLGFFVLVSATLSLFAASFLAVKLSLVSSAVLGAIVGVVLWSIYFCLLVWLGSNAVGSLIGSFVSTATSGIQGMMGAATSAIGANVAKDQAISTAEEITAAVRRELTSGFDPDRIQTTLQNSLSSLQLPNLNLDMIGNQFERILRESDLKDVANSDLKTINRQSFIDLIGDRTDLSKQDINQLADRLESVWQTVTSQSGQQDAALELVNVLKSATPEDLNSEELTGKLDQLVKTVSSTITPDGSLTKRALQFGFASLLGQVIKNTDLSDLDVEKIAGQLQQLRDSLQGQASKLSQQVVKPSKPFSVIQADLENYLLFSPTWKLNRETVKKEFREVIYDPQADPGAIRQELESIDRGYFIELLSSRDDFLPEQIEDLATYLEEIRDEVFSSVQTAEVETQSQSLKGRVEDYLRSTGKEELNPDAIASDFKALLEDPEAGLDALSSRLGQFDRDTLVSLLEQRQDVDSEQANQIVEQLESTRNRVLSDARAAQEQVQSQAQELRTRVEDYLRNTQKEELNPEGIERDLSTLLDDPQAGLRALRERLSQFDRDTLVQLLSQRQDLNEEQINQVLDQIESIRDRILQAPQQVVGKAKDQYEQTIGAIADYLRQTNLDELDPDGIQRDLTTLLNDPKAGASALQGRLAQVDRDTLVQLLTQQGNLSEEQVNQTIDQVQAAIRNTIKAPRRLASRAQKQAMDFEASLEDYLRNTQKEELNPEGIKRDLQLLLQHPQAGLSSLGDRASQFDRSTFVALLSQREDLSEAEANQIADQIESAFKSSVEQIQKVQQTVQSAVDSVFDKLRNSLNSLERPELNYDSIKQDFSTLFDDPQAGFEALRDRLSGFDRHTLVAVLSARDDISEADANRIIDQVEGVRNSVLQRAERIQQEAQNRIKSVQQQAKKQAIETQKVAAGAAWWLFSAALSSLIASAIAGFVAV